MRDIVNFVNTNGGWKLVGWAKKGELADAANESETVENNEVTFHLTYVFPQNQNIVHSEDFQALLIADDHIENEM